MRVEPMLCLKASYHEGWKNVSFHHDDLVPVPHPGRPIDAACKNAPVDQVALKWTTLKGATHT